MKENSSIQIIGKKSIFLTMWSGAGRIQLQSLPFNLSANRICKEGIKQELFANKTDGGNGERIRLSLILRLR